jgi:hypothetical protein
MESSLIKDVQISPKTGIRILKGLIIMNERKRRSKNIKLLKKRKKSRKALKERKI